MPIIKFTQALKRFYPTLEPTNINATTLAEVLQILNDKHEGLRDYIVDDQGQLRKHVNIFIDGTLIKDRINLSDTFKPESEIFIMQALSGG